MERKLYDLTVGQNLLTFGLKFMPHAKIMNINMEFQFDSEVDQHILMEAINLAALRNPNNRIRLTVKDKVTYQYFSNDSQDKIDYMEFSTEEDYERYVKKACETKFPNKSMDVQLYRLSVLKKPNGKLAILGVFSHFIYDAYSGVMLFKEIVDLYKALMNNMPLPAETISPIAAYEEEKAYLNSERFESDKKYFEEAFKTEPRYTVLSGKKCKAFRKNKRTGLASYVASPSCRADAIVIPFEREFTDKVNKYALNNRISTQNVYMLALRTYLSIVCESDDVMFDCSANRRTTLVRRRAGGTLGDSVKFRTVYKNDISFKEALHIVSKVILEGYKHVDFGVQNVESIISKNFNASPLNNYNSVIFTYQAPSKLDSEIEYTIRHLSNGREWTGCYIMIMPCNSNNDYVADYSYLKSMCSEKDVRDFHEFMVRFIEEGLNDDSVSIDEIIKKVGK